MISSALLVIKFLYTSGWLKTIGGALIMWLIPSPIQKAISKQADIKKAEDKADEPGHDVTDLDKLP